MFGFVRNFIGIALGLLSTPLLLRYLGEERFGAFRILLDWISHIGIFELGLYSASLALLTKSAAEGSASLTASLRLIYKNYFVVFLMQILAYICFYLCIDYLIPASEPVKMELRVSALLMSVSLLFLLSQVFRAYLESIQKGYVVSVILVIFNISYLSMATAAAVFGYGLPGQAVSYVVSLFISLVIYFVYAKNIFSDLLSNAESIENQRVLKRQRLSHFISELCGRVSLLSDNIIVSISMGAEMVTPFFITQKATSMMQQQLLQVGNSSWAALSELYYQKKTEVFNARVIQLTEMLAYFSGVTLSITCLLNPSFVTLWTGSSTFAGVWVSNITAINAALLGVLSFWSWCFSATNLANKLVRVNLVHAGVNVIVSLILVRSLGFLGPLYGTLISLVLVSLWWKTLLMSKTFGISAKVMTLSWMRPMLPPLMIAIGFMEIWGFPILHSWTGLVTLGALLTLLFSTGGYFLLLRPETRHLVKDKFNSVLARLRRK